MMFNRIFNGKVFADKTRKNYKRKIYVEKTKPAFNHHRSARAGELREQQKNPEEKAAAKAVTPKTPAGAKKTKTPKSADGASTSGTGSNRKRPTPTGKSILKTPNNG